MSELTKKWSYQKPVVVIDGNGKPYIQFLTSTKRRVQRWVIMLLILLSAIILPWLWNFCLKPWFEARWQQRVSFVSAPVAAPVDSRLQQRLVDYVLQTSVRNTVSLSNANRLVSAAFREGLASNVDPFLVLAVMQVESRYDYTARSSAGALGLMQVIPRFHLEKLRDPVHIFDVDKNIRVGTQILREYLNWHNNDAGRALLQYNGSLKHTAPDYHTKVFAARQRILAALD